MFEQRTFISLVWGAVSSLVWGNLIYGVTGQTADGQKAVQGVRGGIQQLLRSSLGSWMGLSSWAQSWKPKLVLGESKKGCDGKVMFTAFSRKSPLGTQKAAKFNALSWHLSFLFYSMMFPCLLTPSPIQPYELFISLLQILLQGTVQHWPLWRGWGVLLGFLESKPWKTRKRQWAEAFMCLPAAFLSESRSDFIPERSYCFQ